MGCGWFTAGYGSYQSVLRENDGSGSGDDAMVRDYVVTAWRVALAHKVRGSLAYQLFLGKTIMMNTDTTVESSGLFSWVATTSFWPPNWILNIVSIDLQKIVVRSEEGLSPPTASILSLLLPWRRPLIDKLSGSPGKSTVPAPPSQMPSSPQNEPIDPYYHPMAFHTLREYIIRHERGYVHPDLGFLAPAPSGAARGIGMVRDSYNQCQIHCFPGTIEELNSASQTDKDVMKEMQKLYPDISAPKPEITYEEIQESLYRQSTATEHPYTQAALMMRIPLEAQITRTTALNILNPLLPEEFKAMTPLEQLDDAFLLAILLVYEGGLRSRSRFWPYIATLPPHPSCAMHRAWRQSIVDVLTAHAIEMGTDVQGWPNEIAKASEGMDKIVGGMLHFTSFFEFNTAMFQSHHEALRWALCQVASRAVAGNEEYGRLRLVPMMDLINHDEAADMFIELKGNESIQEGHFVGAVKEDAGAFVVRSQRHDRRKVLKKGQELMANYNVPHYSPLDWFINMGYIPPEREGGFVMLDAGLPRDRMSRYKTPVSGEQQLIISNNDRQPVIF